MAFYYNCLTVMQFPGVFLEPFATSFWTSENIWKTVGLHVVCLIATGATSPFRSGTSLFTLGGGGLVGRTRGLLSDGHKAQWQTPLESHTQRNWALGAGCISSLSPTKKVRSLFLYIIATFWAGTAQRNYNRSSHSRPVLRWTPCRKVKASQVSLGHYNLLPDNYIVNNT